MLESKTSKDRLQPSLLMRIPSNSPNWGLATRLAGFWKGLDREIAWVTLGFAFVALTADASQWLDDKGIRLIGIDYLSVQRYYDSTLTHEILLKAGIIILEGLNLTNVTSGMYQLICLPIKLVGSDGAPARAVLIKE